MTDFRHTMVTIVHSVSRSNGKKLADFNFTQTLPVWAAVQAAWALNAHNWSDTDKLALRINSQGSGFTQSFAVCFTDDDLDNCGMLIGDSDASAFWSLVDQFGN